MAVIRSMITFNANSDATSTSEVARQVMMLNASENPSGLQRSFELMFTDGDGGTSNVGNRVMNVIPVNDAPNGSDKTISITEDNNYTFTRADFGFSDIDNDSFDRVWITALPTPGSLEYNGSGFTVGNYVTAVDIDLGLLVYVPANNDTGVAADTFQFEVQDDGGTASGGSNRDASFNTITFDITADNDAPTGALSISGTATQGQTLTADASGIADADGLGGFTYQWLRDGCGYIRRECVNICSCSRRCQRTDQRSCLLYRWRCHARDFDVRSNSHRR